VAREVVNPFQQSPLFVPVAELENVRRFTGTFREEGRAEPNIDRSPFTNYIDMWWSAMCIGVREDRRTTPSEWHRFIDGNVLNSSPWRIAQLELLAIAIDGAEALRDPNKIALMASEFAATGISILVDVMTGTSEPIWAVSNFLKDRAITVGPVEPV
jgi:hypothetical protein